jgi:DNA-binding NarL/FixJ family response regulator
LDVVSQHRPDVVLLDIQMPGMDGLTAAAQLRQHWPPTRIIIVTTFDDDSYITQAVDLNVDGFLMKSADPYELIAGVKAAITGGTVLSPNVARWLVQTLPQGNFRRQALARQRISELTEREREVLALVGAGLSNGQIARRLHLVEGTVKVHVSSILTKLALDNRVRLAVLAHEAGLIPDATGTERA